MSTDARVRPTRTARDRQAAMLAAVEVGAWFCDLPFDVLSWDHKVKEHFWLEPDATVTIALFYERLHPEDRARTREAIEGSIASGTPYDIEYRTVAPSEHPRAGAVRWIRAIGYTAYDGDNRAVRFDGVTVDVTERVRDREEIQRKADELARLTAALTRSNTELDQFASVASHDLRAPLRGIGNLARWIEDDLDPVLTADARSHFAMLQQRVRRMDQLIEGILAYARAGRTRGVTERVDVHALAAEVVELLGVQEGATIAVDGTLPTVTFERVPLQQVLLNLVGNAVKFTGETGEPPAIRVGWRPVPDGIELFVADNGPGIDEPHHDRVWDMFQSLHSKDKVEGAGIGLAVVKKIIEARGGRVRLESRAGAGATFYVSIPNAPNAESGSDERVSPLHGR